MKRLAIGKAGLCIKLAVLVRKHMVEQLCLVKQKRREKADNMFGITYETWKTVCSMYFNLKEGRKKSYLQWFPFFKLSNTEQNYLSSEEFFIKYIKTGAFVLFPDTMLRTENYLQKGDGSFRDSSLVSPILYLVLQSVGMEVVQKYTVQRPNSISVYYAGNIDCKRPSYKKDYDDFFKEINSCIDQYQYYIQTDISNFFSNINLDKLMYQLDSVCNSESAKLTQVQLQLYKNLLSYCGGGRFPLIENSVASSYLATVVYLDPIDKLLYEYISKINCAFSDFKMIRYVDDLYILISSDKPIEYLHEAYNEIRNEYSSILKEYGLSLNTKKCRINPTIQINEGLKKSLYDEYFNGEKCEIPVLFSGKLLEFINDLSSHLLTDAITVEEYNNIIDEHFKLSDVEFTPSEILNYYIYEDNTELQSEEVIRAVKSLLSLDLSFISLDPKRLTVMIMKTHSHSAIKAFLNYLFTRYRSNKWNSYDTTIAISYLIQSRFCHIDLLDVIKKECPNLYAYYNVCCRKSFCLIFEDTDIQKYLRVIAGDTKSYYLFFMYMVETQKNNSMAAFAYYKNFFDRITAQIAYSTNYEMGLKKPNYNLFYKEREIKKFYTGVPGCDGIIEKAHKLRNDNPISHASAGLLDRNSTSQELLDSMDGLSSLIKAKLVK